VSEPAPGSAQDALSFFEPFGQGEGGSAKQPHAPTSPDDKCLAFTIPITPLPKKQKRLSANKNSKGNKFKKTSPNSEKSRPAYQDPAALELKPAERKLLEVKSAKGGRVLRSSARSESGDPTNANHSRPGEDVGKTPTG